MEPYSDKIIDAVRECFPTNMEEWKFLGFVNSEREIFPFGTDSKIIGRLFEIKAKEVLEKAAEKLNLELHESSKQTIYPDFYFSEKGDPHDGERIAVDIKTTYRKSKKSKFGFTAGSFTSYMRNGTKNIEGDYKQYSKHYIIGIVYNRADNPTTERKKITEIDSIIPAYTDIEVFIQEKYRICGESKGSGNTDNIGTIKSTTLEPFVAGNGPFAYLGEEAFHDYWVNYPRYKDTDETRKMLYADLNGYLVWKSNQDPDQAKEWAKKYLEYLHDSAKDTLDKSLSREFIKQFFS